MSNPEIDSVPHTPHKDLSSKSQIGHSVERDIRIKLKIKHITQTRMHPSTMRTVRCSIRCWGHMPGVCGVCVPGCVRLGVCAWVSVLWCVCQGVEGVGVCAMGVCVPGGGRGGWVVVHGCVRVRGVGIPGGVFQTLPMNRMTDTC